MNKFKQLRSLLLIVFICSLQFAKPVSAQANQWLEQALGGMAAISAFSATQYIGVMADGYKNGVYNPNDIGVRIGGLRGGLRVNIKQLRQVQKNVDFDSSKDKMIIKAFIELFEMIDKECTALIKYTRNRKQSDLKKFHKFRNQSWNLVVRLLKLGDAADLLIPGGARLGK
jgi:hypothetical protein